ncbi:glycosyltransferase [Mesobacillus foraminis]|uniref:glycosyltransferase n=1 Tax=Mesobacillus foraminis TaxID=279826 RepID=UPI000EF47001|nr:glycosyltransferase [Mesobacillus foraminis]
MKIWMWPKTSELNKFNQLYSDSLEKEGVTVENFNKTKMFRMRKNDIFHFHWIYPLYQSDSKLLFILKSFVLLIYLRYIKLRGIKIVWTLHNIYPHKYKFKNMEQKIRKKILTLCDLVFVASRSIKMEAEKEYNIKPGKIKIIKHGHYKGVYPLKTINKDKYNIKNGEKVFLFIGTIMEYKGVQLLLDEFLSSNIYQDSRLIIAGKPDKQMDEVLKKYYSYNNIEFDLRFIPDEQVMGLIELADFVVLPYKQITTSGSAILAVSAKKPFIAPRNSFFEEYFNKDVCILYENQRLKTILELAYSKTFSEISFIENLKKLDWNRIAKQTIDYYKGIK